MTSAPVPDHHERVHPVCRAVEEVGAGLSEALGLPLWSLGAAETGAALRTVFVVKAKLDALLLGLVARGDSPEVDLPAHDATVSMAAWLRVHARMAPARARELVRLAHGLEDHPATQQALAEGTIPSASAAVIVRAVDSLPDQLPVAVREQGERLLVQEAGRFDTREVAGLAERLELVVDPEGAEEREAAHLARIEARAERECFAQIRHDEAHGVSDITARIPLLQGVKLQRQLEALLNPNRPARPGCSGPIETVNEKGIRTGADQRRGLALAELIDRVPTEALPKTGGCAPVIVLTMTLETLLGGLTPVVLDTGHRISPGLARRLAASHGVIPAVLGTKSQVLDLGRKARLFTGKQRLAMSVQQGGTCAVEHCDRPAAWGDAHHLLPWHAGGTTDLAGGVLLCRRHHTYADHPDYAVTRCGPGRIRINRRT